MTKRKLLLILLLSIVLVACNSQTTSELSGNDIGNPTAEQILQNDKDADIFVLNDIVYTNAEGIEWVYDDDLTLGEEVGEIKKQTTDGDAFENFTASQLTVGTKIYEPVENSSIYIVIVDDKKIRYLGLIEG
ncbi:hypothetical protein GGQ92_000834 [Gracilibacillus halotolerans]|uniref:Uncharacterized protein n=1 Tax=Gracilibacillus halotolerans TaxID=74386 RepID=A0A841RK98_9BACI|nr:hypothetical protein [Gracilibacillus halotolerans]MBB6512053.1 hypothetical protein [Gracilibacillus halotolerans]